MDITMKQARAIRAAMMEVVPNLSDQTASTVPMMFNGMKYDSSLISVGTRINWNGTLKRAAVDLWDTAENNPENAPTLWEDIAYKDGYRIIPETITAGTAFALGEIGLWKDELYESLLDSNVWTPEQHAAGWKLC